MELTTSSSWSSATLLWESSLPSGTSSRCWPSIMSGSHISVSCSVVPKSLKAEILYVETLPDTTWGTRQGWRQEELSTLQWQTAQLFLSEYFFYFLRVFFYFLTKSEHLPASYFFFTDLHIASRFVDYLIRTPPNLMDKHWAPYSKVFLSIWIY